LAVARDSATADRHGVSGDADSEDACFVVARDEFGLYQKKREILAFVEWARTALPVSACEIGTWRAGTTFLLGNLLPSLSILVGVDRELRNEAKLRRLAPPRLDVHLIEGLSAAPETVGHVAQALDGRMLDLLFIDGGHGYDAVSADFLAYAPLVRDGGIIAFHDIVPDYRTRFGSQSGPWGGDVPKFWNRLKPGYPWIEFINDPDQNGYGIGAVVNTRLQQEPM
jgi:hypothetical protein